MGSFKKFLHHVDIEDVKKKHLEEIAVKKLKEEREKEEKKFIVTAPQLKAMFYCSITGLIIT